MKTHEDDPMIDPGDANQLAIYRIQEEGIDTHFVCETTKDRAITVIANLRHFGDFESYAKTYRISVRKMLSSEFPSVETDRYTWQIGKRSGVTRVVFTKLRTPCCDLVEIFDAGDIVLSTLYETAV